MKGAARAHVLAAEISLSASQSEYLIRPRHFLYFSRQDSIVPPAAPGRLGLVSSGQSATLAVSDVCSEINQRSNTPTLSMYASLHPNNACNVFHDNEGDVALLCGGG